jgi:dienelactone hydrolase
MTRRPCLAVLRWRYISLTALDRFRLWSWCLGLSQANGKWLNVSMLQWAKEAVARGYVAFIIDPLQQRGVDTVCGIQKKDGVTHARGVKDALQAASYLRRFDFVDGARIALVGFSWGGMVTLLADSQFWAATLGDGNRFAAAVAIYPVCAIVRSVPNEPYQIVRNDIDRPLLVLMGDADTEAPPRECIPRLEAAKTSGAPVEWHLYPNASHCFDCSNLDGFVTKARGADVTYHFDKAITADAIDRSFAFLNLTLHAK